jgi:hypothetical protein
MEFTEQELHSIKAVYCPGFSEEQFQVAMTFCRVRNLLPGKHVIFSLRTSKEWDESVGAKRPVTKVIFMTTIDASRLIAERTHLYNGQAPEQYIYLDAEGSPSIISEIPLPQLPLPKSGVAALPREPWAVRTTVYRKDFSQPITSIARFDAYAATYNTTEGPKLNEMWARRGPEQLAKCSEMLSLRKTFPEELGGIYLQEELKPDAEEVITQSISPRVALAPTVPVVPQVNQTPATPTNTPRPTEDAVIQATAKVVDKVNSGEYAPTNDAPLTEEVVKEAAKLADPPKPARKPRAKKESPVNGPEAITQADVEEALKPNPNPVDEAAIQQQAAAAIEEATSFTVEEAVAQGLPAPDDPIPSKEEMKEITQWIRKIAATGIGNQELKEYFLRSGGKTDPKFLTKKEWAKAFEEFHKAELDGRAKEFVKEYVTDPGQKDQAQRIKDKINS